MIQTCADFASVKRALEVIKNFCKETKVGKTGQRKNKKINFNLYVWKLQGNADKWNARDVTLLEENL